jgi:hypothetical protein
MHRRAVGWLLAVILVIPAVALAPSLPPFGHARSAGATGFNFLCSPPGSGSGGGGDSEFSLLANGLAESIVNNAVFWNLTGTVPAGVTVTAGNPVTDPVTGETTFVIPIGPRLGQNQQIDFIAGNGPEITVGFNFRLKAGQRSDPVSMLKLLNQNFGLPLDSGGTDIDVLGLDMDFSTNSTIGNMQGFKGTIKAGYAYKLNDGTFNTAIAEFRLNSSAPGARLPEAGTLSFAFKRPANSTGTFYAFEQRTVQSEFTGAANQPGVGYGFALSRSINNIFDPFLSMDLAWSAAPRAVSIGLAQLCPDSAHIGWNLTGLPNPSAAAMNLKLKSGIEEGRAIQITDASGTHAAFADEADMDGTITGLPTLMDVILLRDALSFTRSREVAPSLDLTRLAMADNDPLDPNKLPLYATAKVTSLPRHMLLTADHDAAGNFTKAEFTSWNLICPGEPLPPGPVPPDAVRRPDLTATLPSFPVGCARFSLTPVPSAEAIVQNWLPEDVLAQNAAAGLATAPLTANQFGFYATRTPNTLSTNALRAFGARIKGLQRATVDLTGAQAGGSKARIYVERAPVVAADDSMKFVGDIDTTTSTSEAVNTGSRITAAATVPDMPNKIRLDVEDTSTSPLHLTWRADAGIALNNAQVPGPNALVVHGAFETGAVGAGALPPAADLQINEDSDTSGGAVHWSKPGAPADTFPTPVVPAFPATTITRVHAGAEISNLPERDNNLATRVHGDINVPQPVDVSWDTDATGKIASFVGSFCDPATPAACAATRFDGTAVFGARGSIAPADLLTPPALPAVQGNLALQVPAFTNFRPNSGVRAIILGPTSWGVDGVVTGVARVAYNRAPEKYEVQLANDPVEPFRVNLLDGSEAEVHGGSTRNQVLFADALVDDLPHQIRVQIDRSTAGTQPLVWVNTENLGITDVTNANFDQTDPPGTRPNLIGVIRAGDASVLQALLPFGSRPTAVRTPAKPGLDLWAFGRIDADVFAVDASGALAIPRQLAVWQPIDTTCDDSSATVEGCQRKRTYEIDQTRHMHLTMKTTNQNLGDLEVNARVESGADLDLSIHSTVGNVPGSLDGDVLFAKNRRLPWTTFNTSLVGNAPLNSVVVSVVDNTYDADNKPANGIQQVQYEGVGESHPTSNYAVELANVPQRLFVDSRVLGVEKRIGDPPGKPLGDPCQPATKTDARLGYVHAFVDLASAGAGGIAHLGVNARLVDSQYTAQLFTIGGTITGFVNARADNVTLKADSSCNPETSDEKFKATAAGIGVIGGFALIGGLVGGPIGAAVGAVIGLIVDFFLDLFSNPTVTVHFDVDVDLPFFLGFTKATEIHAGLNSATLSVGQDQPVPDAPMDVGFRQKSLPFENLNFEADGALYHHRHVSFVGDDIPLDDDWNIGNDINSDTFASVGVYDRDLCENPSILNPCELTGQVVTFTINNQTFQIFVPTGDRNNIVQVPTSQDLLIDFIFNESNRRDLFANDDGQASPGQKIYQGLADSGKPLKVDEGAWDFTDLNNTSTATSASFNLESVCCADVSFSFGGTGRDVGPVCDQSSPDGLLNGPHALANDGTEYVVLAGGDSEVNPDASRALCDSERFVLEAHLPRAFNVTSRMGPLRWSIVLPTPAGLENGGACRDEDVRCEFAFSVQPQADGSVQVSETTTVITNGVDGATLDYDAIIDVDILVVGLCCGTPTIQDGDTPTNGGTRLAWVDASGHPAFFKPGAGQVLNFTPFQLQTDSDGFATIDPCGLTQGPWACEAQDPGQQTIVFFGDGSVSQPLTGVPAVQTHRYPRTAGTDTFHGEMVLLGPNCSDDDTRSCNVQQRVDFNVTG